MRTLRLIRDVESEDFNEFIIAVENDINYILSVPCNVVGHSI